MVPMPISSCSGFLLFVSLADTRRTLMYGLAAWGCGFVVRGVILWAAERPPVMSVALRVLFHVDMFMVPILVLGLTSVPCTDPYRNCRASEGLRPAAP